MIVSTLLFPIAPPPGLDSTYNRLSAAVHVHAFHPDGLLGLADAFGPPCDRHQRHASGRRARHERRDFLHEIPERLDRAVHLGAACALCMGLASLFFIAPPPGLNRVFADG